ncbi:putative response regulator and transcription factor RR-A-type family [Helianthus annuus]|nr:putative response regulator and transcription factor RR-A-type family [Helianthus annuus]
MFRLGDSSQNVQNIGRDSLLTSATPIKVLILDYKKDSLVYVAEVLRSYSMEVTCVDHYGVALKLLTEKNNQYDLVLIDKDITGLDIHTFLRLTQNMDLLAMVMSEKENEAFMHEVFKSGGFRVIKRPVTDDAVSRIRQDVIRYRMHKHEQFQNKNMNTKKATQDAEIQKNRSSSIKNKGKKRLHQSSNDDDDYYDVDDGDDNEDDDYNYNYNGGTSMKEKICVEWTKELHEKFVYAYNQLEEGRRFPKKILQLMGVLGLTRMQVASHLQVYKKFLKEKRNFNEKKTTQDRAMPSNLNPRELNEKKFGCMTSLQLNHEESYTPVGIDMTLNGWQTPTNYMENQPYGSSSMMNISNQENIAQRVEYTQIPFEMDLELNEDNIFGGRITTTHGYFQRTILGLPDSGQGSKNHDSSSVPVQPSKEFPNFLKDLDHNGPTNI